MVDSLTISHSLPFALSSSHLLYPTPYTASHPVILPYPSCPTPLSTQPLCYTAPPLSVLPYLPFHRLSSPSSAPPHIMFLPLALLHPTVVPYLHLHPHASSSLNPHCPSFLTCPISPAPPSLHLASPLTTTHSLFHAPPHLILLPPTSLPRP